MPATSKGWTIRHVGAKGLRTAAALADERKKLLDKFPKDSEVSLFGTPVGKVQKYDEERGRIVTDQGSYNPQELELVPQAR